VLRLLVVGRVINQVLAKMIRFQTYNSLHVASVSLGDQVHSSAPPFHVPQVQSVESVVWGFVGWEKATGTDLSMPVPDLLSGCHPTAHIVDQIP